MKIDTNFYSLEFPKYAKKVRTKIAPASINDKESIIQILNSANILYSLESDDRIGIIGKHFDVVDKLREYISHCSIESEKCYNTVAQRLCKDVQFKALLG